MNYEDCFDFKLIKTYLPLIVRCAICAEHILTNISYDNQLSFHIATAKLF